MNPKNYLLASTNLMSVIWNGNWTWESEVNLIFFALHKFMALNKCTTEYLWNLIKWRFLVTDAKILSWCWFGLGNLCSLTCSLSCPILVNLHEFFDISELNNTVYNCESVIFSFISLVWIAAFLIITVSSEPVSEGSVLFSNLPLIWRMTFIMPVVSVSLSPVWI